MYEVNYLFPIILCRQSDRNRQTGTDSYLCEFLLLILKKSKIGQRLLVSNFLPSKDRNNFKSRNKSKFTDIPLLHVKLMVTDVDFHKYLTLNIYHLLYPNHYQNISI